jgi:hypothetical protein
MRTIFLIAASLLVASPLIAQQGFGPLDPSQPTGMTVDQIIQRMGEREAAFEKARDDYTFRQTVKVDTISDDTGRPDGEFQQVSDVTFDRDGKREEHVVFAPADTLQRVIRTEADMEEIAHRLPFILTTAQLPDYNMTYLGKQKVDDLDTYVFDVAPKTLVKNHKYFQGKVWVDQQDIEIVMVSGTTVPQDMRRGHEDLQPPFTTYYEQIDGKYWFPTYTKAEGILHFAASNGSVSQDIHMRNIVRYTDYKRFRTSVTIHYGDVVDQNGKPQPDKPVEKPQ